MFLVLRSPGYCKDCDCGTFLSFQINDWGLHQIGTAFIATHRSAMISSVECAAATSSLAMTATEGRGEQRAACHSCCSPVARYAALAKVVVD